MEIIYRGVVEKTCWTIRIKGDAKILTLFFQGALVGVGTL
jgi:hypothetical protein